MKRTFQPSVEKEKISTVSELEWRLQTVERCWLQEEEKEEVSCLFLTKEQELSIKINISFRDQSSTIKLGFFCLNYREWE